MIYYVSDVEGREKVEKYELSGSCQVQGESCIMSHLHHIATSDIACCWTSDQAQDRSVGQDRGVRHFLKQKKKKKE